MIDFLGSFYIIDSKRTMCRKKREYLNGTEKIWKILLKLAPPVMFAQLIQALYNIVDSYFVGKYSPDGFTALSVIFPIQLIITALAVGTGMVLSFLTWIIFAVTAVLMMHGYVATSAKSAQTVDYGVIYRNIVCAGSLGIYLESIWTKVHQAEGNMRTPMIAQVAAVIPGIHGFRMPPALREMKNYVQWIYRLGYPPIFKQLLYTTDGVTDLYCSGIEL